MQIKLIKPTIELQKEYLDMIAEWKSKEEKLVPWVLSFDNSNFPAFIQSFEDYSKGIGVGEGMVPHSTYWLMNEENAVVGAVNIRHSLNEKLLYSGGHIGYGIRPSERRKGYATQALFQSLEIVKDLCVEKALVVCDRNNTGSARTIQKNGGILENEVEYNGTMMQRYWIDIKKDA